MNDYPAITDTINGYTQAMEKQDSAALRNYFFESAVIVGYDFKGSLVKRSLDEYMHLFTDDSRSLLHDTEFSPTITSIEETSEYVTMVKLQYGLLDYALNETLMLQYCNDSWKIKARLFALD